MEGKVSVLNLFNHLPSTVYLFEPPRMTEYVSNRLIGET